MTESHDAKICHRTSLCNERQLFPGKQHAMHAVFNNAYLLHEIFLYLPLSPHTSTHRKRLLQVALTCQNFLKPALRILWEHISTILPLFKLLSNFNSRGSGADGQPKTWYLDGPIIPSDIQKLVHFGSCIRSLGCFHRLAKDEYHLDDRVCLIIACALSGQSLLPNLQRFTSKLGPKGEDSSILHLISSPRLNRVEFFAEPKFSKFDDVSMFIQKYANSIHLTTLVVGFPISPQAVQTIPSFSNLIQISLSTKSSTAVPVNVIERLSTLEHIHNISLDVHSFDWTGRSNKILPFENLGVFNIACPIDDLLILLSFTTFPVLWGFTFRLVLPESPQLRTYPWAHLFDAIKRCTTGELEGLTLRLDDTFFESRVRNVEFKELYPGISFTDIEASLLQLDITRLILDLPLFRSLDSACIRRLAEALPEMESLAIHCISQADDTPDFVVLKYLSEDSPFLRELCLDLDGRDIPPPRRIRSAHRLSSLDIHLVHWQDSIERQMKLVSFIDSIFPHPYEVTCSTANGRGGTSQVHLQGLIDMIRQARRRERRYNDTDNTDSDSEDDPLD